jgi:hypothetical protein
MDTGREALVSGEAPEEVVRATTDSIPVRCDA